MKIVRESIYESLNENMQQAKSILKKLNIPEQDPKFQELKKMLLDDNRIGYIGKFTKWLFQDREPMEKLIEVYDMVKAFTGKVPAIDNFITLESLFDFLQGSQISSKTQRAIKDLQKRIVHFKFTNDQLNQLDKLLELNVKHVDVINDYYNKKGRKFKSFADLYKETEDIIRNLEGDFNLTSLKKKIKDTKSNVEIQLESQDILVIRPLDYEASKALGSSSWCISYSKTYWDSYADVFSNQYFIYDFTKPLADKRAMIGVTVNPDGSYKAMHYKDDTSVDVKYLEELLAQ